MPTCVDEPGGKSGSVSQVDHTGRYFINSASTFPVQHLSGAGSIAMALRQFRAGSPCAVGLNAETRMILRLMTERQCSAALIGATLGVSEEDACDLAASLDLMAPREGAVRLASEKTLVPDTLRTTARLYTPRQLAYLARSWLGRTPITEMAGALARSEGAIKRKLRTMGFLQRKRAKAWADFATLAGIAARQATERAIDGMLSAQAAPAQRVRSIFHWTRERTAALCARWLDGWTPARIAHELGTTAGSVSTRATRASLPARTRSADGRLEMPEAGHICLDHVRQEYFWSRRRTATQSAYRAARSSGCSAFC